MFKSYLQIFLLFSLISCEFKTFDDTGFDIFIIAGQSNTLAGIGLDAKIDTPDKDIFQLGRFSIFDFMISQATEPLQHHTARKNKIGFGLTFAKLYKNHKKKAKPILLIPCGFGGASLKKEWEISEFLYKDLIERVNFVKQKHPKSIIKAVLWHQGEADTGLTNYDILLDKFINSIRKDLKSESLPFILGGMVPFWVSQNELRKKQQEFIKNTPLRQKNTAYADPNFPFVIKKENDLIDKVHYDAKGQRELGKRYFSAYLSITE